MKTKEDALNIIIKDCDTNKISDGFHTFEELYEHRIQLFIALCSHLNQFSWKSKVHSDGSEWDGWFIMGLFHEPGTQITYHLPISKWEETDMIPSIPKAPDFDGHSSADVLNRLKNLRSL